MTVAPLLIVTPVPIVMDVAAEHSHAVSEENVTFWRTTGSPEQWEHAGSDEVVKEISLP